MRIKDFVAAKDKAAGLTGTRAANPPKVGDPAPEIMALHPDGNGVPFPNDLKGKVVLVVFWELDDAGTGGMPFTPLRKLRAEHAKDDRFLILTVCVSEDRWDQWSALIERQGKVDHKGQAGLHGFTGGELRRHVRRCAEHLAVGRERRFTGPLLSSDEVAIVLHRLGPVVHQVLVDVVGVDERFVVIVLQELLGEFADDLFRVAACLEGFQRLRGGLDNVLAKFLDFIGREGGVRAFMDGECFLILRRANVRTNRRLPCIEVGVHPGDECGELVVIEDGGLDRGLLDGERDVAGPVLLEKRLPQIGEDGPVAFQGIHVADRDAALEVPGNVLNIFGRLVVDVSRQVQARRSHANDVPPNREKGCVPR